MSDLRLDLWAYCSAGAAPTVAHLVGMAGVTVLEPEDAAIGVWSIRGIAANGPLGVTVNARTPDGRTGSGTVTV